MMRRIDAQYRIVRMLGSNGRGITETFWEVQKKRILGWKTVATFGNSTAALVYAKELLK